MKIFLILIIYLCNTINCSTKNEIENLHNYLINIKNQIDSSINPCNNFAKYSCGNLYKNYTEKSIENYDEKLTIKEFLINIDKSKLTEPEQKAINFYKSCNNYESNINISNIFNEIDSLKLLKSWPTTNDNITENDISKLLAELASLGQIDLIKISFPDHNEFTITAIESKNETNQLIQIMQDKFNVNYEDAKLAGQEINEFLQNLSQIFDLNLQSDDIQVNDLDDVENELINFNWNNYFEIFFYKYELNSDNLTHKVNIKNPILLKEIIKLINLTNPKIIINHLIWKYIKFIMELNCNNLYPYFRPVILNKLWKKYITNNDDEKHLKLLEMFEKSFHQIKSTKLDHCSDFVLWHIETRKMAAINHTLILNDEIINQHYQDIDIDEFSYYKNLIDICYAIIGDYIVNGAKGKFTELHMLMLEGFGSTIDIWSHNKPFLYNYVTLNWNLWQKVFQIDLPVSGDQYTDAIKCLDQLNDHDKISLNSTIGQKLNYLWGYATNKQNYLDFNEWLIKENYNLKDELELFDIDDFKGILNYRKAYFLALAQHKCHESNDGTDPEDLELFRYLKHTKEFSDVFECKSDDPMYDYENNCNIW